MGRIVRMSALLSAVLLLAPSVVVLLASFNPGRNVVFPPRGITLAWYKLLFSDPEIRRVFLNSLYVGLQSVVIGVVFGVPATLALYRRSLRGRAFLNAFLSLGFTTPLIVSGVAFLLLFTQLGIIRNLSSVGIALSIILFPFMVWAVASAVSSLDPELEQAAATMGADKVQRFLFVTLPGIAPGIIAGSLLMFVFGITEFLVSLVLVGVHNMTLPVYLFGSIRENISPLLAAVAAMYIVLAAAVLFAVIKFGRLESFLHQEKR